jgi:hypothetical protein
MALISPNGLSGEITPAWDGSPMWVSVVLLGYLSGVSVIRQDKTSLSKIRILLKTK